MRGTRHLVIPLDRGRRQLFLGVLLHEFGQEHGQSRRHRSGDTGGTGLFPLEFLLLLDAPYSFRINSFQLGRKPNSRIGAARVDLLVGVLAILGLYESSELQSGDLQHLKL